MAFGVFIAYSESENYRLKYYISGKIARSQSFKEEENRSTKIEGRNKCLIVIKLILFLIGVKTETILLIVK